MIKLRNFRMLRRSTLPISKFSRLQTPDSFNLRPSEVPYLQILIPASNAYISGGTAESALTLAGLIRVSGQSRSAPSRNETLRYRSASRVSFRRVGTRHRAPYRAHFRARSVVAWNSGGPADPRRRCSVGLTATWPIQNAVTRRRITGIRSASSPLDRIIDLNSRAARRPSTRLFILSLD